MQAPELLDIEIELERILSSKVFRKTTVLSNFLRYVVIETLEGRVNEIKEYSIAVKALGKPADFNPQIDAVIRIHAGRLRRNLTEYYHEEGIDDPVLISLKKGSYIPEFGAMDRANGQPISTPVPPAHDNVPTNRVAVLPFKNLSGLPENDFMVDGFCEQLSSDLAQFHEITVISYFSTSKFREEKADIRKVGKELNASHLITGSIYRDKKHLRISMQLVNVITGAQLWTQTYDRAIKFDYLYEIFDDIIKQVVPKLTGYYGVINRSSTLSTQLDPSIGQDTIDAVFWYHHYQMHYTEEVFRITLGKLEKAVQQNPDYALAWAMLAELYLDGDTLCCETVSDPVGEANKCVHKALQLDPDCQHAYLSLGWMHIFQKDKRGTVKALERGMLINPTSSFFLGVAAFLFSLLGDYDKSTDYFNQSVILNPYYAWWVNLGPVFTHVSYSNYVEALEFANRINIPGVFWDSVIKIAVLGQLSRPEAAELAAEFETKFPGKAEVTCSILKAILFDEIVHDRIKEGLNKAGLSV